MILDGQYLRTLKDGKEVWSVTRAVWHGFWWTRRGNNEEREVFGSSTVWHWADTGNRLGMPDEFKMSSLWTLRRAKEAGL